MDGGVPLRPGGEELDAGGAASAVVAEVPVERIPGSIEPRRQVRQGGVRA